MNAVKKLAVDNDDTKSFCLLDATLTGYERFYQLFGAVRSIPTLTVKAENTSCDCCRFVLTYVR